MKEYPKITMDQVKPGDIFFSGGNEFIQKAIRFFTKSIFSHSGSVGAGPVGILSCIQTTESVVTCSPLAQKLEEPCWMLVVEVLAPQKDKEDAFVYLYENFIGVWYGYLSYLWFMYRAVARLFGKEPEKVWKWVQKGITCTELTSTGLVKLGPKFQFFVDLNGVSPQELFTVVEGRPEHFRVKGWLRKPEEVK